MDNTQRDGKIKIYHEKPTLKGYIMERTDKTTGTSIWFAWEDWLHALKIDKFEKIKLLPKEIQELLPKWDEDIKWLKEKGFNLGYPVKLAKIEFIYKDHIYLIFPDLFKNCFEAWGWCNQALFEGISEIIKEDLIKVGCLYVVYSGELD